MSLGKVALFGAGGAVGRNMVPVLEQRGVPYRVVGRDTSRLQRAYPNAESVRADFLTGEGVEQAAAGTDTIFYLAGAPYTHFEQHPLMTHHALAAAQAAHVARFVHIAPVYSYGQVFSSAVSESQPRLPDTRKGRFRLEQEQAVLAAHGRELQTLVVQLPDFYGPHAQNSFANYFMHEAIAGKAATFIGPLNVQREFVYLPDVPGLLLDLASCDDVYGRYWNLAGAGRITGSDFATSVFEALGRPIKVRSVSKFQLQVFGIVNPLLREFVEMFYLYETGLILDDSNLRARLGNIQKTPYDAGMRQTLEWMKHSTENMSNSRRTALTVAK